MTCDSILTAACNMASEASDSLLSTDDFTARAPYIIASFCGMASVADKHYRHAFSLGAQRSFNRTKIELSEHFPLCDRFISAATAFLAAMLISVDNPNLSESLREMARHELTAAYDEIPATLHGVVNVYN